MVIPKRKDYKMPFIAIASIILVSSMLIVANAIFVRALTMPEAMKKSESFSQNKRTESESKKSKAEMEKEQPVAASTKPSASTSPAPALPPPARQVVAESRRVAQQPTVSTVTTVQTGQSLPSEQKPADTSAVVRAVASEQADKPAKAVYYDSAKISTIERERLYQGSLIVAATGVILYMSSYAAAVWQRIRREQVGVRRTITQ